MNLGFHTLLHNQYKNNRLNNRTLLFEPTYTTVNAVFLFYELKNFLPKFAIPS